MFIRPVSDIHNEFSLFNLPATEVDDKAVLVLAGDIAVAKRGETTLAPFLDAVAHRYIAVVYIPGNHEYYNDGSLLRTDDKLRAICERYPNVHYMNRKSMLIEGVRFIGATLWTDFHKGDPLVIMTAHESMNDYECIRTGSFAEPYRRAIRPVDIIGLNLDHRHFITHELKEAKLAGEKVVVFTHHSPSFMSRSPNIKPGPLDYAYYNDCGLEELMLDYEPLVWIHGHSHFPVDYMIGNTRVVSNPRGYSYHKDNDEGLGFVGDLVIEL
jgi:predicted phosphodiesterase